MPLFRKEKKNALSKLAPKLKVCPDCLKPALNFVTKFSGIYAPGTYICLECGYEGKMFLDTSGDDAGELSEMEKLVADYPEDLIDTKSAQELACECLQNKWHPDQQNNQNELQAWCPFCADVQVNCVICKCPPEICSHHASKGLIGDLGQQYEGSTKLCDVAPQVYQEIVNKFKAICRG